MDYEPFENLHKFQDDVWGQIRLNDVERDLIDTPEYQRLFRTSQLGFVKLVYHTANHTRALTALGLVGLPRFILEEHAKKHDCMDPNLLRELANKAAVSPKW